MISKAEYRTLLAKGFCEFELQLTKQPQINRSQG